MSKSAYIDKTGKAVIDASRYESAGNFSDGLASVEAPRQGWGFIDKTGAMVIPPKFESTLGFKEGLAPVVVDDKWGFINKSGTLVIENQFDFVAEFSEGMAIVDDKTGKVVIPVQYEAANDFSERLALVSR